MSLKKSMEIPAPRGRAARKAEGEPRNDRSRSGPEGPWPTAMESSSSGGNRSSRSPMSKMPRWDKAKGNEKSQSHRGEGSISQATGTVGPAGVQGEVKKEGPL